VAQARGSATTGADGALTVRGLNATQVGDIAFENGVRLHELTVVRASLEAAFMELTADSVEYRAEAGRQPEVPFPGQAPGPPALQEQYSREGRT
jgi:ABC-2 type transport system ATP-binding protein